MKPTDINPCIDCPGRCCSRNLINVCGYDAWVIARMLSIRPTDFLAFAKLKEPTPYNFLLDGSGEAYYLVLNMKEQPDGSRRCTFSLDLPRHQERCGIYAFRPIACRAYPMVLEGGEVALKECILCPEGAWKLEDLDIPLLREQMGHYQMEFCIYGLAVIRWNEQAAQRPPSEKLDFRPFVNYIMNVYDRLQGARERVPHDTWPRIWHRWRVSMASRISPLGPDEIDSNIPPGWEPWIRDIHRVVGGTIDDTFAFGKRSRRSRKEELCPVG